MAEKVVWKYPLTKTELQYVSVPRNATFLHVDYQRGDLCLWALVDPHAPASLMPVCVVGTGWSVPEGASHIGTVQDGPYVWHVFTAAPHFLTRKEMGRNARR